MNQTSGESVQNVGSFTETVVKGIWAETSSLTGPSGISSVTTNKSRNRRKPYYGIWVWKAQGPGRNQFQVRQQEKEKLFSKKFYHVGVTKNVATLITRNINVINFIFVLTYNMSLKTILYLFGLVFMISLASGNGRRYSRSSTGVPPAS